MRYRLTRVPGADRLWPMATPDESLIADHANTMSYWLRGHRPIPRRRRRELVAAMRDLGWIEATTLPTGCRDTIEGVAAAVARALEQIGRVRGPDALAATILRLGTLLPEPESEALRALAQDAAVTSRPPGSGPPLPPGP